MDYRLALENAQRNVEKQKLALEKASKAVGLQNLAVQPATGTIGIASSKVDTSKVKQYLERRRQEQEAKKAANPSASQRSLAPPSGHNPASLQAAKSKANQNGQHSSMGKGDKKGGPVVASESAASRQKEVSSQRKRHSGDGISHSVTAGSASTEAKKPKSSHAVAPLALQAASGAAAEPSASRQYLLMRRQELLKELDKIDRKLQQLDQAEKMQPAQKQQQHQAQAHNHQQPLHKGNLHQNKLKDIPPIPKKPSAQQSQPPPRAPLPLPQKSQPRQNHRPHSAADAGADEDDEDAEEEEEDDDSFIDDSEEPPPQDYSQIVREVHRSLKFDPRRYASVNPHDDCRGMVASYGEIEREERRSKRLGIIEDAEDERAEAERRQRRLEKRKLKGKA